MDRRALSALSLAALLLASDKLSATPRSALRVDVEICESAPLDAQEIARAVRAELEADGLVRATAGAESDGTLLVSVDCDAPLSARIRLRAAGSNRESQRTLALSDAGPSARSGVLALLASELVRSDWLRLSELEPSTAQFPPQAASVGATSPAPSSTAAPATAAPSAAAASPSIAPAAIASAPAKKPPIARTNLPPPRWALAADARLRWFIDYASVGFGGSAGADRDRWRLRAEGLFSSSSDALGSALLGSAAACVGYRALESKLGPFAIAAYPMAAGGLTWLRGSSRNASTRIAPTTGFYADLRLVTEARLSGAAFSPTLALELGRATGYVARSEGKVLGATGGFFIGANMGGRY